MTNDIDAHDLELMAEEPPTDASEVELAVFALDRMRATFAWKTGGLDAEALRRAFPPSAMTLGGLVKHLAFVEDWYAVRDLGGDEFGAPWTREAFDADPEFPWNSAKDDSPEELYALWQRSVQHFRNALVRRLAAGGLEQESTNRLPDGSGYNLRRVLTDLQDEYARHTGHADLFREAVDGLVGEDPPRPWERTDLPAR